MFITVMISVRTLFLEEGFVSRDDMAFPFEYSQIQESLFNRFSVWYGKIGGGFNPTLPSSIPFWFVYDLFALLLRFDVLNKIVIAIPLIIASFSMYKFSKKFVAFPANLLASLLYAFNPWVFDHLVSGHLYLLIGYSLMPIPLIFIFKLRETTCVLSIKEAIFSGLVLALILDFTVHVFALVFLLVMLYVGFTTVFLIKSHRKIAYGRWIGALVIVFALALLLNFFWLLPTLMNYSFVGTSLIEPAVAGSAIESINHSMRILDTLRLMGYWLHYFQSSIEGLGWFSVVWSIVSFAIPALSFAAPCLKKSRSVIFFGVVAVTFLVPSTIASSFPSAYSGLISYIPLWALFRDSSKFIAVVCLSYSILIGSLFETLLTYDRKLRFTTAPVSYRFRRRIRIILAYFAISLVLATTFMYSAPNLVSGDFMGTLSATSPPSYLFDVRNFFAEDRGVWRVLWTPPFSDLHYDWCNVSSADPVDEYFISFYAVSGKSTNPFLSNYVDYLTASLYEEHYDTHLAQAMAPLNIKYVVARLDAKYRWAENQYPASRLQEVLEHQQGLSKVFESGKWIVYENTYVSPFITTPSSNVMIVFGDFSEVKSLGYMFEKNLPCLLFINPENSSSNDAKLIAISNDAANNTAVTIAIPFDQSFATGNLLEQITGKTRVMYFTEGEKMTLEEKNLVPNFSFEEGLAHWNLGNEAFSVNVAENATDGRNSIEVTTSNNATWSWSWITSDDIPIVPKTIYRFSSNIKMFNSMQSHVKVVGFNETSGDWEAIGYVPLGIEGTLDWTPYEFLWENQGFSKIRMVLNAGWVKDPSAGNATTLFDSISVTPLVSYDPSFSNGRALPLQGKSKIELRISNASNYRIGLRAFATETSNISVKFTSNDIEQTAQMLLQPDSSDLMYSSPIYLTPNNYTLEVSSEKPVILDALVAISINRENETLQDFSSFSNEAPAEVVVFERVSSTSYTAEVNASSPFLLSFAEPYDASWIALVNGQRIEPVPLYSVINGFWINETGLLEITIEYEPQRLFYYGSTISIVTLIACFACLAYDARRNRARLKKMAERTIAKTYIS
jgi:hypothetical protein